MESTITLNEAYLALGTALMNVPSIPATIDGTKTTLRAVIIRQFGEYLVDRLGKTPEEIKAADSNLEEVEVPTGEGVSIAIGGSSRRRRTLRRHNSLHRNVRRHNVQ